MTQPSADGLREQWLSRTAIRAPQKVAAYIRLAERDGALCNHCGAESDLTLDHVDPQGGNGDENLQILCRSCNSSKGTSTEAKTVRWSAALLQQGFTMVPNLVLLDAGLSVYAHRVYSLLLYYARQDEGCWPGQEGLASKADCGERTIRAAVRELEARGLIKTRRRGQGRTNVYILQIPTGDSRPASSAGLESREAPTAGLEGREVPIPIKREKYAEEEETPGGLVAKAASPPAVRKIDGRNLGFDALAETCGIDVRNRVRVRELTAALKGIRIYAWEDAEPGIAPEAFERLLETEVRRRAAAYRSRMSGATLTPKALEKWWHDVDGSGPRRGVTGADFSHLDDL